VSTEHEPLHIAVIGAGGRMGSAVVRLAVERGHKLHSGVGRNAAISITAGLDAIAGADVAIDFSTAALFGEVCSACTRHQIALVSGTTGLDASAHDALRQLSAQVAVLWEPNMSLGVYVLGWLAERATQMLGPSFDIELVEVHHRRKLDAPSGTALRLGAAVREARQSLDFVHGREGQPGARDADELGMHAVRGGDVIGDHTLHFLGNGERLELTHRATSRELFAAGALRAAEYLHDKPAGRYGLSHVLGIG
jgi:4-hydroxy-tetrahydrodipicolinate reductase